MRMRTMLMGLGTVLVLAVPAAAVPVEYTPTFTRADRWLHANGSPSGNVDAQGGKFVRWDDTKPTAPTGAAYVGNNYGYFADSVDHNPVHFLTMKGQTVGDLDTLAYTLFFTGPGQAACDLSLSFQLVVDDKTILDQDYTGSAGITYERVNDTTYAARFALTNIWKAAERAKLARGADVTHDVYLNVQNFYLCNELVWHYDSAAAPSDVVVNLPAPGSKGYFEVDVVNPPPPIDAG